jgi:sulfhydrogenase subunit beta (sulfur reductase)
MQPAAQVGECAVIDPGGLDQLLGALRQRGYQLVGPTVADGAIGYGPVSSAADLPAGWTDEQDGGSYRLRRRDDEALFGYNVGPQSAKRYLFPPSSLLWTGEQAGGPGPPDGPGPPLAFIGLRSCELHAIAVQDRVFLGGDHPDPDYAARRDGVFLVAVNCGQAGGTCFCVSMGTGPKALAGFDLALTELLDGGHRFLVEIGSRAGGQVLGGVDQRPVTGAEAAAAAAIVARTAASMGRAMDTGGIKELLYANYEHPEWDDVAARCLDCGNCTMACPTCFCFRVEEVAGLAGDAARRRSWDSCFTLDHSYLHGGTVRASTRSRYRQWMTHKLATWIDQFGTSGCVGCGRCITWCPVGIDITAEAAAIRLTGAPAARPGEVGDGDP